MTQDEIKDEIASFIAAQIATIKATIEQTPRPPWMASEGSREHAEHEAWVHMHLWLLDWEDKQIIFEEFLELDQHEFTWVSDDQLDETTWRATIHYRHKDILEALEKNDRAQLNDAFMHVYGEKAAAYEIKLKLEPGQRPPPPRDHKLVKAIQDVAFIRDLWKRRFGTRGKREEGDCLRPEWLSADYHGVLRAKLLTGLKNKRRILG